LLRTHIIIKEAEGRLITNRAMVHQLNIMRKEMYRGYVTMDSFRSHANEAKDHDVSHSFDLFKFNHANMRCRFSTNGAHRNNELQQVIQNLNNLIDDASEFNIFLKNYPPLYRQPYNMHLFIDKCVGAGARSQLGNERTLTMNRTNAMNTMNSTQSYKEHKANKFGLWTCNFGRCQQPFIYAALQTLNRPTITPLHAWCATCRSSAASSATCGHARCGAPNCTRLEPRRGQARLWPRTHPEHDLNMI
ncbi:hypothetical protein BAE44_0025906, partial [Dichanthelium oligosanthes]